MSYKCKRCGKKAMFRINLLGHTCLGGERFENEQVESAMNQVRRPHASPSGSVPDTKIVYNDA